MDFFFWAVREGKEDDPRTALEDPGLLKINGLVKPIWSRTFEDHAAFVKDAIQLLGVGFANVIEHPALEWYGQEHQETCDFGPVCYRHTRITIDDGGSTPIKAQIDSRVLLDEV